MHPKSFVQKRNVESILSGNGATGMLSVNVISDLLIVNGSL